MWYDVIIRALADVLAIRPSPLNLNKYVETFKSSQLTDALTAISTFYHRSNPKSWPSPVRDKPYITLDTEIITEILLDTITPNKIINASASGFNESTINDIYGVIKAIGIADGPMCLTQRINITRGNLHLAEVLPVVETYYTTSYCIDLNQLRHELIQCAAKYDNRQRCYHLLYVTVLVIILVY